MENQWSKTTTGGLPESPRLPMEFLSRSWSASALQVFNAITPPSSSASTGALCNPPPSSAFAATLNDVIPPPQASDEPFATSGNAASQFLLERIMSERTLSFSQEISPLTSGRPSHSSGPLIGESPRLSPSQQDLDDVVKLLRANKVSVQPQSASARTAASPAGSTKTVGRWLKERREKKKEETRTQNAQLHAAISVAGVAAAVAAMAAATANSGKNGSREKTDLAMASAATLVAAQCVEAAEIMGADRGQLSAVIGSAVNIKCHDDIVTLTAAAATALRGAATLRARAVKEIQNAASVTPVENFMRTKHSYSNSSSSHSGELVTIGYSPSPCNLEFLAKGYELLKRTRKGDLHWKIVSVYIHRTGEVMLKMKSKHVKGTITKKKKNVVVEVLKHLPMWPGRHLLEDADQRHCFGLRTVTRRIVEFECKTQQEHDIWTEGVTRLLSIVAERKRRHQA